MLVSTWTLNTFSPLTRLSSSIIINYHRTALALFFLFPKRHSSKAFTVAWQRREQRSSMPARRKESSWQWRPSSRCGASARATGARRRRRWQCRWCWSTERACRRRQCPFRSTRSSASACWPWCCQGGSWARVRRWRRSRRALGKLPTGCSCCPAAPSPSCWSGRSCTCRSSRSGSASAQIWKF